jgi:hypothetical protein
MADPTLPLPRAFFRPRPLENLIVADELESLDPIIDSKVLNLLPNSDTPQIFAACGRGARSTFRTLRHGLEVEESVSSDLPGIPNAVWTTKRTEDGGFSMLDTNNSKLTLLQIRTTHTSSSPSSTVHWCSPSEKRLKKCKTPASSRPRRHSPSNRSAPTRSCKYTRKASDTSSPTAA